jgi:hypothetical protein
VKDTADFAARAGHSISWEPTLEKNRTKSKKILNKVILVRRCRAASLDASARRPYLRKMGYGYWGRVKMHPPKGLKSFVTF